MTALRPPGDAADGAAGPVRLLIVVPDPADVTAWQLALSSTGYHAAQVVDTGADLESAFAGRPEAAVLVECPPADDSRLLLTRLGEIYDVPVLYLPGADQGPGDIAVQVGHLSNLAGRIKTLLGRSASGEQSWADQVYDDGVVHLDPQQRRVMIEGAEKRLDPTQFRLLEALVRQAGAVLSSRQLLTQAWDDPAGHDEPGVTRALLRLQHDLGWRVPDASPIESLPGFGYRYRRPVLATD